MEITPRKYGNRTVYRNTKIKRLIYIQSIPILSELIPVRFSLWKTPDRKGTGKGAGWHNTQFCGLRSTRETRQDRWKPITNGRKSSMPATRILTPAGASTISTSLSGRTGTTTSLKAELVSIQLERRHPEPQPSHIHIVHLHSDNVVQAYFPNPQVNSSTIYVGLD